MRAGHKIAIAAITICVLAGGTVVGLRFAARPAPAAPVQKPAAAATATIERRDLSQAKELQGTLGYTGARTITGRLPGVVTWLPKAGASVTRGDVLYRADDVPVVLFYGDTPMFRTLGAPDAADPGAATDAGRADGGTDPTGPDSSGSPAGPSPSKGSPAAGKAPAGTPTKPPAVPRKPVPREPLSGPDIEVLRDNLAALGVPHATRGRVLDAATRAAIASWQKSLGEEPDGVLDPGEIVVLPGKARIDGLRAELGGDATGAVLSLTSTTKAVTVMVDADADLSGFEPETAVKVALPNGKDVGAAIAGIGRNAAVPADGPADGQAAPQLPMTVRLDKQSGLADLDSGPVTVTVPGTVHKDVLVVPVAALLALQEGGYALQVITDGATKLVGVKTGLFADDVVEVSGDGLEAGQSVVSAS